MPEDIGIKDASPIAEAQTDEPIQPPAPSPNLRKASQQTYVVAMLAMGPAATIQANLPASKPSFPGNGIAIPLPKIRRGSKRTVQWSPDFIATNPPTTMPPEAMQVIFPARRWPNSWIDIAM